MTLAIFDVTRGFVNAVEKTLKRPPTSVLAENEAMLFNNQWRLSIPDFKNSQAISTGLLVTRPPDKNYISVFFASEKSVAPDRREDSLEALNSRHWVMTAHHDSAWRMDGIQGPLEKCFLSISSDLTRETGYRPIDVHLDEIRTPDFHPDSPSFEFVQIGSFNPRAEEVPAIKALNLRPTQPEKAPAFLPEP